MTPAVRLRNVEDRDIDVFFDHQADPQAVEMAAFPSRDKEAFAAHWAKLHDDDTKLVRTVVADGMVAGNICSWEDGGRQLLGYWVGREYWGRGVATQALALFADEVSIRPLYAHVAVHNVGSIRVLRQVRLPARSRAGGGGGYAGRRHRGADLRSGRMRPAQHDAGLQAEVAAPLGRGVVREHSARAWSPCRASSRKYRPDAQRCG